VIGNVALVAVTGELYRIVAQRLKKVAPYGHTVVVTIANGKPVGYIPTLQRPWAWRSRLARTNHRA
jgi:hypothetical protein